MNKMNIVSVLVTALLVGCSSTSPVTNSHMDLLEKQVEHRQAEVQKEAERKLALVPDWVLNPPKADEDGVYGVGISDSKQLDVALKKAAISADYSLAKTLGQELSGNEQSFIRESSSRSAHQYTELIDSIVRSVPVHNVDTVKQEVKVIGGSYHVYKLVKLSFEQFEHSLMKQSDSTLRDEVKESFIDLERRLKNPESDIASAQE